MVAMRDMVRHPSRAWEETSDAISHTARQAARRPYRTGGILLVILAILGIVYMFPEMHREVRLMRM